MSAARKGQVPWNKGKVLGDAFREAISKAQQGKPKSAEHRAKIGDAQRGKPKSAAHAAATSRGRKIYYEGLRANGGIPSPSAETRARMSAANKGQVPWSKGRTLSAVHRQRIGASLTGRHVSVETRQKLSAAQRVRWVKVRSGLHHAFLENGLPVVDGGSSRRSRSEILPVSSGRSPLDLALAREVQQTVSQAMGRLGPAEYDCFSRHYFSNEPIDLIARETGLPRKAVEKHVRAAARALFKNRELRRLAFA